MRPAIREPVEHLVGTAPFWAALPEAARRDLASHAVRRRFRRGQRLLGADDRTLLTIVAGRAELLDHDGDVIRSIDAPATVGLSLALGAPSSAELRACDDGVLVSVPGDAVAATLHRHPDAAIAALLHLATVIADLSATLEAERHHGLEGRLRHRLRELAHGRRELRITHAELAAEVGGTRANVSRALARFETEGWLRRRRGRLELLAPGG